MHISYSLQIVCVCMRACGFCCSEPLIMEHVITMANKT